MRSEIVDYRVTCSQEENDDPKSFLQPYMVSCGAQPNAPPPEAVSLVGAQQPCGAKEQQAPTNCLKVQRKVEGAFTLSIYLFIQLSATISCRRGSIAWAPPPPTAGAVRQGPVLPRPGDGAAPGGVAGAAVHPGRGQDLPSPHRPVPRGHGRGQALRAPGRCRAQGVCVGRSISKVFSCYFSLGAALDSNHRRSCLLGLLHAVAFK